MSYILDALKKSEQQRLSAGVPNLHSGQPVPIESPTPRRKGWVLVLVLGGINLAAVGWWLATPPSAPARNATAADVPQAPAVPRPAPPSPPPTVAAAAAQPSPASPIAQAPWAAPNPPVSSQPVQSTPSVPAPVPRVPPVGTTSATGPALAALPPTAPPPRPSDPEAAPPAPPRGIVAYADLPASLRSALPPLKISGYIDGDGEAMLVVDDRLVREGGEIGAGVRVIKISPDGAVFGFKNYRFRR